MQTAEQQLYQQKTRDMRDVPPDTKLFIESVIAANGNASPEARELFAADQEIFVTRAPGRLDVMGGIADYSGSLVLQLPIKEATHVALQRDAARTLKIISRTANDARHTDRKSARTSVFEMPLDDFINHGKAITYEEAYKYFQRDAQQSWAAYAAGAFLVLMRERGMRFAQGARLLISSCVPEGKGVSSSAAIEVATMSAVCAAFGIDLAPRDLALLCQKVENLVVGAPCGVMDQMASVCGEEGKLLALLCQPAELQGTIKLPDDLAVWGLDSGVRHSVGGGDYGSVRAGAFMGYRIIAELAGFKAVREAEGQISFDDPRWQGYLANITPSEFESFYAARIPERIAGAEFLAQYKGTTDSVTRVNPARSYPVLKPTAHAINEHFRVRLFVELLNAQASEQRNKALGELMYQSHASYSACGLGSEGTDLLVNLVREISVDGGLYAAKITGGGSGGTVAVLGKREAGAAIREVATKYRQATKHDPYIFAGSSHGSAAFGFVVISIA